MTTFAKQFQVRKLASAGHAIRLGAMLLLCMLAAGCLARFGQDGDPDGPTVVSLSTQQLSVGSSLEINGGNFAHSNEDYAALRFRGTFFAESGQTIPIDDFRVRPHWLNANQLVWSQVGPFANPFSPHDQIGTFDGEMVAINVSADGTEAYSKSVKTTLEFGDSISIRSFRPRGTNCGEPVKRLLGGFPYELEVEAIGFEPVNFTYSFAGEEKDGRARVFRQPAKSRMDSFGRDQEFRLKEVADDVVFYLVHVTVSALGTDGKERSIALDYAVHRPIEYIDSGKVATAEIMAPKPDNGWGCIGGGPNGRSVTYTETATETRDRQIGINWTEAWTNGSSTSKTLSHTVSEGIRIENNGSTTNTSTFGWESSIGATGGVNVWVISASLTGSVGRNGSYSTSYTNGWSVGRDYSTQDTETWAYEQNRSYTLTKGGQEFRTVSSSDSKSLALTGEILSGQFGVFYRQLTRMVLPGALVAYSVCGSPSVVGETAFTDYTWSVDLAMGPQCPPFPKSNLREAQCFVQPCSGE